MSEWRESTLGDVATMSWGDTSKTKAAYTPEGFLAYSASGPDGFLPHADRHGDGVVISAIGAKCGKTWLARGEWSCIKNTMWFQAGPDADTRFLYYATSNPDQWPKRGAAQPFISLGDAKRLRLRLPPLTLQRKIASVLGALDALLENNRHRIEVLEEMTGTIYREWFVHFRYPGHEDVPLVDSALGSTPQGWAVVPLAEAAELTMGQSPRSEFYNTEGLGKPFHQGVADFGAHFPVHRKFCTMDTRLALDGDVLVSVRAPVGRINVADTTLVIGRGLAAVRSRLGCQNLLLACLRQVFAKEDSMGGGTIFNAIGKKEFQQIPVVWPPNDLAIAADETLAPIFALIRSLTFAERRLSAMRDHLLPALVTGRLDVSHLDLGALAEAAIT